MIMINYCQNLWLRYRELEESISRADSTLLVMNTTGDVEILKGHIDAAQSAKDNLDNAWRESCQKLTDGREIFIPHYEVIRQIKEDNNLPDAWEEDVLSHLILLDGAITELDLRGSMIKNAGLAKIECLAKLHTLEILNLDRVSCEKLDFLRKLPNLKTLLLSGAKEIGWLDSLPKLELLSIENSKIDDLTPLSRAKLKGLALDWTPFRDLAILMPMKDTLEVISLNNTGIRQLELIKEFKKLTELYLNGASGDPDSIGKLTDLTILEADETDFINYNFLVHLTNIEELSLKNSTIVDLKPLAGLSNLRTLNLGNQLDTPTMEAQPDFLEPLANLNIENLHIRDSNDFYQNVDFSPLLKLNKLESLGLWRTNISGLQDQVIEQLRTNQVKVYE